MITPSVQSPAIPIEQIQRTVAATARALWKHKPNKDGVVSAIGNGLCGIEVGAVSVERCIAILDALAQSLDAQNLKVIPTGHGMSVRREMDEVTFRLSHVSDTDQDQ